MAFLTFDKIRVSGVAAAVPTKVVQVESFVDRFGKDYVEKFKISTGIKQFHQTAEHQTASDLCYVAAKHILEEKNIERESIGALIFVAHSTDYRRPATACVLHKRLKLSKDCVAFDISLGCSAFVSEIVKHRTGKIIYKKQCTFFAVGWLVVEFVSTLFGYTNHTVFLAEFCIDLFHGKSSLGFGIRFCLCLYYTKPSGTMLLKNVPKKMHPPVTKQVSAFL